jgi:hypothetical protein
MPTIKLTDSSPVTADAALEDTATLGATPNSVLHFVSANVIGVLDQPLDAVEIKNLQGGFSLAPGFSLKGGAATFSAGGNIAGSLELFKPAKPGAKPDETTGAVSPLFPADQFGSAIEMHRNCYAALGLALQLKAGVGDVVGAYTLKPAVASTSTAKLYLPFAPDATQKYPSLKVALTSLLQSYKLPSTIAEVFKLPAGSVFVYDAQGRLSFSAKLDLLTEINPTASLDATPSYGPISITAGPTLTVGGGFALTGEFQVRFWNKDGKTIQLGYYKKRDTTFSVSFDASAGADATIGGFDIVSAIYGLLGSKAKLDPDWVKANIPASVAAEVQQAYKAAVETKLSIAIDEECDTSLTDQVAFSWDFHTDALDADAQAAFTSAIHGDITRLMDGSPLPAGVTKAGSVFDTLTGNKHKFTFNFLGLFDHASVEEASLQMTAKVADDGQVVLADKATLTRLGADATPFIKSDLLRKVLAEDFVATVGYSTSLGHLAAALSVHYSYYVYLRHAGAADLANFVSLAALFASKGDPKSDWAAILRSGAASQNASSLASLVYDNPSARKLFLDAASAPLSEAAYEAIARKALTLTPGRDLNPAFIEHLSDDAKWQQIVKAGAVNNFYAALGADPANPPAWATAAYAWTQHILNWSPAMHAAAQALSDVLTYVARKPDLQPLTDAEFIQKRTRLAQLIAAAVKAAPLFHDALGIVTILLTAKPSSETLEIRYAGKTSSYS